MTGKNRIDNDTDPIQSSKIASALNDMFNRIIHDVTTPLTSIRLMGKTFEKLIPPLLGNYKPTAMTEPDKSKVQLSDRHLKALETMGLEVESQVAEIQRVLDLYRLFNQKLSPTVTEPGLSIRSCVQQALENPLWSDAEALQLIHVDCEDDFNFIMDPWFIEHLLFVLIKNSMSISKAGKGKIYFYTQKQDLFYVLHCKHALDGMDKKGRDKAFRSFLLKDQDQIVPGLGFCRLKWLLMGGDIVRYDESDQYSHFEIKFPMSCIAK